MKGYLTFVIGVVSLHIWTESALFGLRGRVL